MINVADVVIKFSQGKYEEFQEKLFDAKPCELIKVEMVNPIYEKFPAYIFAECTTINPKQYFITVQITPKIYLHFITSKGDFQQLPYEEPDNDLLSHIQEGLLKGGYNK